jgi:hypothetical protein
VNEEDKGPLFLDG